VKSRLLRHFGEKIDRLIIALEPYSSPRTETRDHFHVAFALVRKEEVDTTKMDYFDPIFDYHGNYKSVPCPITPDHSKFWVKVRYCMKYDLSYLKHPESWDPDHEIKAGELQQEGVSNVVGTRILETPWDPKLRSKLYRDHPGFYTLNATKIKSGIQDARLIELRDRQVEVRSVLIKKAIFALF